MRQEAVVDGLQALAAEQSKAVESSRENSDALLAAVATLTQKVDEMQVIVNVPAQPAPIVNVAPSEVIVEAVVPTPSVTVEVPRRTTVTEFEHDADGNVTKATQKEI